MGKGVARIIADPESQKHDLTILSKSAEQLEKVRKELKHLTSNPGIYTIPCDLTRLSEVKNAIQEIHDKHEFPGGEG